MSRRSRRLSALLLALCVPALARSAPAATPGAATPFRLGAFRLFALRDALNVLPNDGSVIGKNVGPAAVAPVLAAAGAPTDKITLGVDALLAVEPGGRTVLIDTGLGPKVHGALPASLAAAGVRPEQVTDVLITHSHPDHVGGLLTADGRLAFPRATIRMSAAEWDWLRAHGDQALAAAIAARVQPFQPGGEVVPGVTSVALPGHTPGHVGYELRSGGQRLLDIGDLAHSSIVSLARPDWVIGYDNDPDQGRAQRKAELARVAAAGERVFAPHFPYPGVGRVARAGQAYAWRPGLPR